MRWEVLEVNDGFMAHILLFCLMLYTFGIFQFKMFGA